MSNSRLNLLLFLSVTTLSHPAAHAEEPRLFTPALTREAGLGDELPKIELRLSDGRLTHLQDFRGKAVAITFFYSRCPLPTFCPMVSRDFDQAQALLLKLGLNERCHLLSISLDAEHDTPEVLAAHAQTCHADPKLWTFACGQEAEVLRLGKAVGLECKRTNERIDHNLRTVVIDGEGRLRHVFRGGEWTPQELAAALQAAARAPH